MLVDTSSDGIGAFTVTSFTVSRGGLASLVGKRFVAGGPSHVFCWDSFPVCPHFTHLQDHDYVLYWCGVHWELCGRLVLFFLSCKKRENEENFG